MEGEKMSVRTVKVAISLPKATLDEIEHLRHKLNLPRSRAILEAVSLWLKKKHEEGMDKKYLQGYKRKPEEPATKNSLVMAGLSSFSKERW